MSRSKKKSAKKKFKMPMPVKRHKDPFKDMKSRYKRLDPKGKVESMIEDCENILKDSALLLNSYTEVVKSPSFGHTIEVKRSVRSFAETIVKVNKRLKAVKSRELTQEGKDYDYIEEVVELQQIIEMLSNSTMNEGIDIYLFVEENKKNLHLAKKENLK